MCFKSTISVAFIIAALCVSCVKRDAPPTQPAQVNLTGTGECLSDLKREMTNFVDGNSTPDELHLFWSCMHASIQKFQDITSGDGGGENYSASSLRHFIEHYLYKGKIPDDVLVGIMQVKRILLAGDTKQVTPAELARLHGLFDRLHEATVILAPHMRVLLHKDQNASEVQVRAAGQALQQAAAKLGVWLVNQNQTLTVQTVSDTLNAFARWTQEKGKNTSLMQDLKKAVLVLPEAKSILLGGDKNAIAGQEWAQLTSALSRGLYLYVALSHGLDQDLEAALTRVTVPESAAQALDALSESARRHPQSQIALAEFKALYAKIEQTEWLPDTIKEPALTAATKWLLARLLGGGTAEVTGLTVEHLGKLHRLTEDWQTLGTSPEDSALPLVQEFNAVLAASQPIAWDALGRMRFPATKIPQWSADSRPHMVWPYVVLKFVKQAYVGDRPALNEDDVNTVAQEVLPLLQNFGWMKSTQLSIGRRILREADLFTLASNGDGLLDLNEATRYLAFVMGSYRTAQVWLENAKVACPAAEAECVREQAFVPYSEILSHLPRLQKVMATWTQAQFTAYMKNAEQTILGAPEAEKFTTGDLLQTYQLFEYVEVFLELYDRDASETIDLAEAISAYEIYGPTLGRLLPNSDLAFFTFMMKYGDTPFTMYGGQIAYNNWVWNKNAWSLQADRKILMGILSQLAKFASQ